MRAAMPVRVKGLLAIGGLALGLRLMIVALLFDTQRLPFAYEHGEIARNLLAGRGFAVRFLGAEGSTSQQAPFYPLLLALGGLVFGVDSPWSLLAVQLLQALAGAATAVCLAGLCWSLLPDRPALGWLSASLVAVHPVHVYSVVHLQVAIWATFVLIIALWAAHASNSTSRQATLAGALAGLLLLIEPILALAVPVFVVLLAFRGDRSSARRRVGCYLVALAAVLAPWLVRNYLVHGEIVFVKSTLGYAFWQGNNRFSLGTDKIPKPSVQTLRRRHDGTLRSLHEALWQARHETIYIDDRVLTPADYRELASLGEPRRSRLLARQALAELSLGRYIGLCLTRLRYFLLVDETHPKAANAVYRACSVLWLTTAIVGAIFLWPNWRQLWSVGVIFTLIAIFHAATITAPRFRIPVETLTYPCCSAAIVWLCRKWQPFWMLGRRSIFLTTRTRTAAWAPSPEGS
jgi:hypothetical protein